MPKAKKLTQKAEVQSESTSPERLRELAQDPKLAKVVAGNYVAPPDLLEELSHTSDKTLLKACVSNPNTPTAVLLKLGSMFPEQLLENPVFDILLIENPNLLAEFPKSSLNSLLKREVAPVSFLRWAAANGDEKTLQSLLINPNVPADVVQQLTEHRDWDVAMAAKLHVNSGVEIDPDWETEGLKKRVPEKENERVTELFSYVWPEIKNLPLLQSRVRRSVAENPNCPVELLTQLAHDEHDWVRKNVARHPNCPGGLLDTITESGLEQFTKSSIPTYDRLIAFRSLHCPTGALAKNYRSRDWVERCAIAEHPKTPEATLQKLLLDGNRLVRQKAKANLDQRQEEEK